MPSAMRTLLCLALFMLATVTIQAETVTWTTNNVPFYLAISLGEATFWDGVTLGINEPVIEELTITVECESTVPLQEATFGAIKACYR